MPTVVHRIDKHVRFVSADDADLFSTDWILNPDLSAVEGVDPKYWKIVGDSITEMSPAEKAVADTDEVSSQRDKTANAAFRPDSHQRAFALLLIDEINLLREQLGLAPRTVKQFRKALRQKLD